MDDPEPRPRRHSTRRVRWSDGGAFGVTPEWVLRSDAKPTAKLLYAFLALYAGAEDATFRGKTGLARDLNASATTVERAIADLVRIGALSVEERIGENGARLANGYTVHVSPRSSLADPPHPVDGEGGHPADEGGSRARGSDPDELDPSPVAVSGDEGGELPTPPKHLVGGRDLGFDALARVCGVNPSGPRAREVAVALYGSRRAGPGIRALVWQAVVNPEFRERWRDPDREHADRDAVAFERAVVTSIESRARAYRRRFQGAEMTPGALAKWYLDLDVPASPAGGAAAPESRAPEPELTDEERAANRKRAADLAARLARGMPNVE